MSIRTIKSIGDMKKFRSNLRGTVGFIPAMGYLHEGHLSLVRLAQSQNDHAIVSIFVNPKQFAPHEDFQKYPRDIERDLHLLEIANTNTIFLPSADELYPDNYQTYVEVQQITKKLEGKSRPEHFTGVATVVTKFFNIIQPARAYFGQKDAQQVAVIKRMVADLNMPIEIVVGGIVREVDGLAMSSRNVFLNADERKEAAILYQSLCLAKKLFESGENNGQKIKSEMSQLIKTTLGQIDYISFADTKTLNEVNCIENEALVSMAVYFGKTRLIDNIVLRKLI